MTTIPSAAEANRMLATRFFEEQDRLRGSLSPALCARDYTATIGSYPVMDREGHDAFGRAFYQGFPDIRHEIRDVFASDDRAAVGFVLHGTHEGSFFGIAPSGKSIRVAATVMLTIRDGQVTRLDATFDEAGMLRQIGVLKT